MTCITDAAHAAVRAVLQPGETAVDATCGNGHDTLFLAEVVGPEGRVYGFDVQPVAIDATQRKLLAAGVTNVALYLRSHAELAEVVPAGSRLGAVMFNLGYLPNADRRLTTRADSTRQALAAAVERLRPGGVMTIVAYSGHPGAAEEMATVEAFVSVLPSWFVIERQPFGPAGPVLFVVRTS